jgi:metal-responsive CopG/Arc/MetJ family transcriptional regulator
MKTIQMTLDDDLVSEVDEIVKQLRMNRSAFTRLALRAAIDRHNQAQLEQQHRQGYERRPVAPDEFSVWESEQQWGDA